ERGEWVGVIRGCNRMRDRFRWLECGGSRGTSGPPGDDSGKPGRIQIWKTRIVVVHQACLSREPAVVNVQLDQLARQNHALRPSGFSQVVFDPWLVAGLPRRLEAVAGRVDTASTGQLIGVGVEKVAAHD